MISIVKAGATDALAIANIGRISVEIAHRDSCSATDMNDFLDRAYSTNAIKQELENQRYHYHMIYYQKGLAGFSKVVPNEEHPNIPEKNVMKLDRIYLLPEYFDKKLGAELLKFNIGLASTMNQRGIWLFTWVGNERAVNFYRRFGFRVIGDHKFEVTKTHFNEHHQMYLTLPGKLK